MAVITITILLVAVVEITTHIIKSITYNSIYLATQSFLNNVQETNPYWRVFGGIYSTVNVADWNITVV